VVAQLNPLLFALREFDAETGLWYNRARYLMNARTLPLTTETRWVECTKASVAVSKHPYYWQRYKDAIERHLRNDSDYSVIDLADFTPEHIEMIRHYIKIQIDSGNVPANTIIPIEPRLT